MTAWGLPTAVEVQGISYAVRTDFRVILDICAALSDPELSNSGKAEAALDIFYPDFAALPPEHWKEALEVCFWFIRGGAEEDGRESTKLVDWEQDAPYIAAPINRVLGVEIRSLEYLHWWTFLGAYMEIGDCTFAQIVRIRDRLAHRKPLDKEDRVWYRKNRHLVDFQNTYTSAQQKLMKEWGGA